MWSFSLETFHYPEFTLAALSLREAETQICTLAVDRCFNTVHKTDNAHHKYVHRNQMNDILQ